MSKLKLPRVVGLYSPAPRCGKSTVAEWLVDEHGFARLPFAKILKDMARPLLAALGYDPAGVHRLETGDKTDLIEVSTGDDTVTLRHLYQTLGTEWGRNCIHPDLWIRAWSAQADQILSSRMYAGVVADDMRFPNELAAIRREHGAFWAVKRKGVKVPNAHGSEGQLDGGNADFVVNNDGSLEDLAALLSEAWSH